MENENGTGRAILASLGMAGVFEMLTVPATQDKIARAASPWKDDPYHTVVWVAQFAVPVLALAIALRLLAWRAPGAPDRAQQTARAAGAMTALVGLALAGEWAAVIDGAHGWSWGTWNAVLITGLVVISVSVVVVTVLLVRCRSPLGASGRWRHDWLGDVVFGCRKIPVLRRWAGPDVVAWVRRRAMTVFVALSLPVAVVLTGFQAVGEHLTDPLLIGWFVIVDTAANLACCVVVNAVAGFVARPPRTRPRRIAETSVVTGCVATLVAVAFHDSLWPRFSTGPLTSGSLTALTLGAGVATSVVTAALLLTTPGMRR